MTTMPDLIAQTRICKNIEKLARETSTADIKDWQDALIADPKIGTWLGPMRKTQGGKYELSDEDYEHFMLHLFHYPNTKGIRHGWWESDVEAITTEGVAQLFEHLIWDKPYAGDKKLLAKPRGLNMFWLCPVTYYYRTMITKNPYLPDWVTWMVITPPKPDHPEHYKEYKKRLRTGKTKEKHEDMPDDYDELEEIWVTSSSTDSVKKGKKKSDNSVIDIGKEMPSISKIANVETVQLYCEPY